MTVGNGTHLGTGATVIPGISIGSGSLFAAGSLVIRDAPDSVTVKGVPAKMVTT